VKKKVHRLNAEPKNEHAVYFGISSTENDYRLSWMLNEKLGLNLTKIEDQEITDKSRETKHFPQFECFHDDLSHRLIKNKTGDGIFLPKYKTLDFVLVIEGESAELVRAVLLKNLKEIKEINLAIVLDKLTGAEKQLFYR